MQKVTTVTNSNGTTTVTGPTGKSYTLPTNLWQVFAQCTQPTALAGSIVPAGMALGYTNGYVRACVQALAQPGQYSGSACIGAITTTTQGKKLFCQFNSGGAPAPVRPKLTRKGSGNGSGSGNPAAQAAGASTAKVSGSNVV